jgi:hypothetical protein
VIALGKSEEEFIHSVSPGATRSFQNRRRNSMIRRSAHRPS